MVDAATTHRRATLENARGLTYVHDWEFEFTDPNGVSKSLSFQRDVSDAFFVVPPHRFDDRTLTREIRAGCGDTWWPTRNMDTPCTMEGVRLRYYPGDLTLFDLPDFPRLRFGSCPVRGWTEAAVVAALLSVLALFSVALGVRSFVLILG